MKYSVLSLFDVHCIEFYFISQKKMAFFQIPNFFTKKFAKKKKNGIWD